MKKRISIVYFFYTVLTIHTTYLLAEKKENPLTMIDSFFLQLKDQVSIQRHANDKIARDVEWLAQYDNPRYLPKKASEKRETDELISVKIYGNAQDKELLKKIDQAMRSLKGVHIFSPSHQEPGRQPHIPYMIGSYLTINNDIADTAHIFYSPLQSNTPLKTMESR